MVKCKCGVELFSCDIVDTTIPEKYINVMHYYSNLVITHIIYRCPKCFEVKKAKI